MTCNNITKITKSIPNNIKLIAVTKTKPTSLILEAYKCNHRDFGENKVQELAAKESVLPKDINWHFIGHLQRNKVKYLASFVHLIHGVDSFKLLKEINKQGLKNNRIISCLLQFHISSETTKFGLTENEALTLINSSEYDLLSNIKLCGVMGMATNTKDKNIIANEFKSLRLIFENLKKYDKTATDFNILSMGMSSDYKIAINNGSNMLRLGSLIFGKRT